MAGIKQPILDILTQLSTIMVVNTDLQTVPIYARIWNNQLRDARDGKGYTWPRPAIFVEIINPVNFEIIGLGFRSADLGIRLHLIHDFTNQDGTYEQDLPIFDLRDQILVAMSQFLPTACGPMNCISEEQEYDHDNLYHYIFNFVCNFIDSKGSPMDPAAGKYDETANPLMDATVIRVDSNPIPIDSNPEFIIPPKQF